MNIVEEFLNLELDIEILNLPSQSSKRRKYVREYILREDLIKHFMETLGYSAHYLCNEVFKKKGYKADPSTIIEFCKNNNIKTYSIKERANSKFVRDQYKSTCLKKYGAENSLSKNTKPYKKRNKTVKTKYEVENVFQLKTVKEKGKKTMMEKYGVTNSVFLPTYERNYGRRSKLQKQIENILIDHNVKFEIEVQNKFKKYNEVLKKEYSPIVDILIENKKIVLEIYGDLWHGNPRTYKSTDKIFKWSGETYIKDIWHHDKLRKEQIESFGYSLIELWEYDIRNDINYIIKILNEKVF